ncbi:MAG: hypothetical protein IJ094_03940, partial [Bacilli bacterium]|nr:hypothetical protein [Bacilli bacterium]
NNNNNNNNNGNQSPEYLEALKLVELAEQQKTKKSISDAYNAVNLLEDNQDKIDLINRLNSVVLNTTNDFMMKVDELHSKIDDVRLNVTDVYNKDDVKHLAYLFNNLYKDEVSELNFKKSEYGDKLNDIIYSYNMQEQNNYKLNADVTDEKPFSKWQIFKEWRPLLITSISSKLLKKRLVKATEKDNQEKVIDTMNKIREVDIINSPKLFRYKNKLAKLKPKLYRNGVAGLDDVDRNKYNKYNSVVSLKLLKGLIKIYDKEEAIKDKIRVKTVIGQWLELISKCPDEITVMNKTFTCDEIVKLANNFIKKAVQYETITIPEAAAYKREISNIMTYRSNVDSYYEIPSSESIYEGELNTYDELNSNMVEYYEAPILYKDSEGRTSDIAYIKQSRR